MVQTHEEHGCGNLHLALRAKDSDDVGCSLFVREANLGIRLRLNVMDENALLAEESAVILAWNRDRLINVVLILRYVV